MNPQSATVGAYGLEVRVGDECSSPDTLSLSAPPGQIQGDFEACFTLTAENVEVMGAGATFRSGGTIQLGDGFSVASNVDFTAAIVPALGTDFASVDDPSPIAEVVYNATFYLRLDDLVLATGDSIEHFTAYSGSGESQFILTVRKNPSGQNSLHLAARENGGGLVQMIPGQELPLTTAWNKIDIEWTAGDGNGAFLVAVNDGSFSGLTNLSNSAALVETVRWGAINGSISTTTGLMQLDSFNSWR
ncbi:MAG: hypothetical protein GY769_23190 [bacterium]|nr:hypothetical protein [bacterium]